MTPQNFVHPLKQWRLAHEYTAGQVARMVVALAPDIDPSYSSLTPKMIDAIERGYRRPGYELCLILSKLMGGTPTAHELRMLPLRKAA